MVCLQPLKYLRGAAHTDHLQKAQHQYTGKHSILGRIDGHHTMKRKQAEKQYRSDPEPLGRLLLFEKTADPCKDSGQNDHLQHITECRSQVLSLHPKALVILKIPHKMPVWSSG